MVLQKEMNVINEEVEIGVAELKELQEQYKSLQSLNARYPKADADSVGYASSSSFSSDTQPNEDANLCYELSDADMQKKKTKAFQDSLNTLINAHFPEEDRRLSNGHSNGLTNGHSNGHINGHANGHPNGHPNVHTEEERADGHVSEDEHELMHVQKQLISNTNQVHYLNARLKMTSVLCEREIKEIKTFLLFLDKRNTEIIKKTTKSKSELFDRVKKVEGETEFVKIDQKEIPLLRQRINSFEKTQLSLQEDLSAVQTQMNNSVKKLSMLESQLTSSQLSTTRPVYVDNQLSNIEKRLVKSFLAFFLIMLLTILAMTYWVSGYTSHLGLEWQTFKDEMGNMADK